MYGVQTLGLNITTTEATSKVGSKITLPSRSPEQIQYKTYQVEGATTSGTGSVTVVIEGSNTGNSYDLIGTITLTLGTTITSDSFTSFDRYEYMRSRVTAISGTGAYATSNVSA